MTITLVRHAEVEEKYLGCYNGHIDIGLSAKGYADAKELEKHFKASSFDAIFCSDLKRAKETLKEFIKSDKIIYTKELREKSWGDYEGMSFDEIVSTTNLNYLNFKQWTGALGGEPIEEFISRVEKFFFEYLPTLKAENILVVTHSGVIKTFLHLLKGLSLEESFCLLVPYASFASYDKIVDKKDKIMFEETFKNIDNILHKDAECESKHREMIKLDSLSIKYNDSVILDDISLEIDGHLNILGANGSGKSTLARAICGLVEYGGEIYIDGQNIKDLSLKQRAKLLTYIPTKLEVYDEFISVEEFVLLGRFAYKDSFFDYSSSDKKIAKNTLEFLNISHLASHAISSLSSGEAQLVSLASALVAQSKIIILDEPTANLDPHNAKVIAKHIKGLKEYHQIILITHDLELASFIGSPTLFLKDRGISYFEKYDEFYNEAKLEELYKTAFSGLSVRYE